MIIKRIIAGVLVVLLLNINFAYAENWVTITAENGKSADLDLDSIQLVIDTVEYNIKTETDNHIFINKFSTELYKDGTPTAVVERSEYIDNIENSNKINEEKIEDRDYKELKSGTLQAEIFDVLSKKLGEKGFDRGKATWNKYLKKQRKQICKEWKPIDVWTHSSEYITPVNFDNITIMVKKDGSVDVLKDVYSSMLDREISDIKNLDPLPENYTADTFQLNVNMNYYKYAGAKLYTKKPVVKQISPTVAEITIAKNQRPPIIGHIEFGLLSLYKTLYDLMQNKNHETISILNDILFVLKQTFKILAIPCIIFIPIVALLCILSGVSVDDL